MAIRFRRHANSWMRPPDPVHERRSSGGRPGKNTLVLVPLPAPPRLQSVSPANAVAPLELSPEAVIDITEDNKEIKENE